MESSKVVTLYPYSHQLGGHHLMLEVNREQICKPLCLREKLFYDNLPENMKEFTPYFYGVMNVQFGKNDKYTGDYVHVQESEYSNNDFIILENLTGHYQFPCMLDLKLGTRYYTNDMSLEHVQKLKDKAAYSTASVIGLKLCGMQLYNPSEKCYHFYDKLYGYSLNKDTFSIAIKEFVQNSEETASTHHYCIEIVKELIMKLKKLKHVISTLESCRFYSSSLLIIYEGQREEDSLKDYDLQQQKCIPQLPHVDVRMIDFAKYHKDPLQYKGPDRECIFGLTNLILILESIMDTDTLL